jgi:hypothetical protein
MKLLHKPKKSAIFIEIIKTRHSREGGNPDEVND